MYRFGVEIEVCSLDFERFRRIFQYPYTDCMIMDFKECTMEGNIFPNGQKRHIPGCINCKSDNHVYFHIIRDLGDPLLDLGDPLLIEIVTPVLKGSIGFKMLHHVCDCLIRANAKIDIRCGLHIHVDASEMSLRQIIAIISEYKKEEDVIDCRMKPERRNQCKYAKSLREYDFAHIRTLDQLLVMMPDRNCKVNVQSLRKYGTLEFRQHHGSVCYDEIRSWIFFIMSLCNNALNV